MTTLCKLGIVGACCVLLLGCSTCEQDSCHGLVPGGKYRITLHESQPTGRENQYPACQANFDLSPGSQLIVGVNGYFQPTNQAGCCQVATNIDLPLSKQGSLSFEDGATRESPFAVGGDHDVVNVSKNVVTDTGCKGAWALAVVTGGPVKLVDKPYDPKAPMATLYRSFYVRSDSDPRQCTRYHTDYCVDAWGVDIQTVTSP